MEVGAGEGEGGGKTRDVVASRLMLSESSATRSSRDTDDRLHHTSFNERGIRRRTRKRNASNAKRDDCREGGRENRWEAGGGEKGGRRSEKGKKQGKKEEGGGGTDGDDGEK